MEPATVLRLTGAKLPHKLACLPNRPEELYLVGELPRSKSVALVGTRHPTAEALDFVETLVSDFARAGYSIWSGGAEGIDGAAHRAALKYNAKTVVVAPAGWMRPYPEGHERLFREIVENGGGYLSLVPAERAAFQHQFFARNAVLVALSDATLVVQAPYRSGARNAAKVARRLGRPLFAVPSCPWIHQGVGCNLEIGLGARPIGSAKEVIAHLRDGVSMGVDVSDGHAVTPVPSAVLSGLEGEVRQLMEEVVKGASTVDELCLRTGATPAVVQSVLLRLTLLGVLRVGRSGEIDIVTNGN